MKLLRAYIDRQNPMAIFRNGREFNADNLTADDVEALANYLAHDLSPENLCCDGELKGADLRCKCDFLCGVKSELLEFAAMRYPLLNLQGIF